MTTDIERRVGNLLQKSKEVSYSNAYSGASSQMPGPSSQTTSTTGDHLTSEIGVTKEKFSIELRDLQNSRKVLVRII